MSETAELVWNGDSVLVDVVEPAAPGQSVTLQYALGNTHWLGELGERTVGSTHDTVLVTRITDGLVRRTVADQASNGVDAEEDEEKFKTAVPRDHCDYCCDSATP